MSRDISLGNTGGRTAAACAPADDEKVKDKTYLSRDNQILRVHSVVMGNVRYVAFQFKKRLDAPNSKGKGQRERSNYGDSASTYCYKRESDLGELEKPMLIEWTKGDAGVNLVYTCGEAMEEEKRKNFPGFAETNCVCQDFTFIKTSGSRFLWR